MFIMIDVRTQSEWDGGHISCAKGPLEIHKAPAGWQEQVDAWTGGNKDYAIYTYCATGVRAGRAAKVLKAAGYTNVTNGGGYRTDKETLQAMCSAETTTVTSKTATAATTTATVVPFFCDPSALPATGCVCPAACAGGSCRQRAGSDPDEPTAIVCKTCLPGFVKVAAKCVRSYTCKASKVVLPVEYAGEPCKCKDKNCNQCTNDGIKGEACESCRNSAYYYDSACYSRCSDANPSFIELGTGIFKRRCIEHPFTCEKEKIHVLDDGKTAESGSLLTEYQFGCKCPDSSRTKTDHNCRACNFNVQAGQQQVTCTRCKKDAHLHSGVCYDEVPLGGFYGE